MTDREIIETIRNCISGGYTCSACPLEDYGTGLVDVCMGYLLKQALDVMSRQEELINASVLGQETLQQYYKNNSIDLPCKIGDIVYVIRHYREGIQHVQKGIVHEMYFTDDMELCISVKHIARGKWGETIFPTKEAAESALGHL